MKLTDVTGRTMAILVSGNNGASGKIAGGNFAERLSIAKRAEITGAVPKAQFSLRFTSTLGEVGANLSSTSPTANVPSALTRCALLYNLSLENFRFSRSLAFSLSLSPSYIGVMY